MANTAWECDGLLFDLDGVLIDSTHAVEVAWGAWMAKMGIDPVENMPKIHGRRVVESLAIVAPGCDIKAEEAWLVDYESTYTEGVTALNGAKELLASLPEDAWGIVTSGGPSVAMARVTCVGLPVPRMFVTGDDVQRGKPDPQGYLLGAERLKADPTKCVVFEDVPAGVESGKRSGARVVGVLSRHEQANLPGADAYVKDLSALLARPGTNSRLGLEFLG